MLLMSISFENMHQILRNLYDTMTKLCQPMMDMGIGCAGSFILHCLPCLAVSLPCGADRCFFNAPSFCTGYLHPLLRYNGAGNP